MVIEMSGSVCTDFHTRAHQLCCEFIGGTWNTTRAGDIRVKPLLGGMSNHLYICSLSRRTKNKPGEPRVVLIRIYGCQGGPEQVLLDTIVFAMLSERHIGPRLLGVFKGGRIEEYLPCRALLSMDFQRNEVIRVIATKTKALHSLQMPLSKEPRWIYQTTKRWLKEVGQLYEEQPEPHNSVNWLLGQQLEVKLECLKSLMEKSVSSPVVFCHNDLQAGNILIKEDGELDLTLIDYEYCGYNFRGFELANHFNEWTFDYGVKTPPYFRYHEERYPSSEQLLQFLTIYLGPEREHEYEGVLTEIRYYSLASHLLWTVWAILQHLSSEIEFGFIEYAETRYNLYTQGLQELGSWQKTHSPAERKVSCSE